MIAKNFREGAEGGLINYSFSDVATGFGIVKFNAFASTDNSGEEFSNTTADIDIQSDPQGKQLEISETDFTKKGTINFDNPPNNFLTRIKGKGFVDFTFAMATNTARIPTGYVIAKIQVVDKTDVVIATIGSVQSAELVGVGTGTTFKTLFLIIDCDETNIRPTDRLRLSMELWGKAPAAGGGFAYIVLPFDPANRELSVLNAPNIIAATNHTYLKWYVPYKIDL